MLDLFDGLKLLCFYMFLIAVTSLKLKDLTRDVKETIRKKLKKSNDMKG